MRVYEFSIVASGLNPQTDDFEARFYNAGCGDATVSFQKGHIIVDFARQASGPAADCRARSGTRRIGQHPKQVPAWGT
jgi:hypothetical protein